MRNIQLLLFLFFNLHGYSQQPIFVTISGGNLYSLNLSNCTSRLVGSTGHGFADMAFTPDGKLWGIEGGILYLIDTTNASTTAVGATGTQAVSLVALDNATLLAEYENNLYGINIKDGANFLIGNIGYRASGDLTWYDNDLYMTSGNLLIKILMDNASKKILSVYAINKNGNLIPTCEGSVTASFPGLENSIIGFSGSNAYKICQLDGSTQLLCPAIVPNGIPGAASITLPPQNPRPIICFGSTQNAQHPIVVIRYLSPNQTAIDTGFDLQNATLVVYNAIGQKVRQMNNLVGRTATIDHQNLAAGVYLICLFQIGQKLIVERTVFIHQ